VTDRRRSAGEPDGLELALRALRHRDRSIAEIEERLERRGVGEDERAAVLTRLTEAGYLDDGRYAARRAEVLAARGAGDELIASDLQSHGVGAELVGQAIAGLAAEADRAAALVEERGASERTLRFLATRGFREESLERVVAHLGERTIR
jgi:regulatory protein